VRNNSVIKDNHHAIRWRRQHLLRAYPRLGIQVNKTHDDMRDRGRLMCNLTSLGQSCGDFSPMRGFRVSRRSEGALCCAFDEGRSLGAALQEEAPNRHERLRPKAAVVNVMVKRRDEIASGVDERDERK